MTTMLDRFEVPHDAPLTPSESMMLIAAFDEDDDAPTATPSARRVWASEE